MLSVKVLRVLWYGQSLVPWLPTLPKRRELAFDSICSLVVR